MDRGNEVNTLVDEEPVDFYKLYFWPAEIAPDEIIKQQSRDAAYWHNWAQEWTQRQTQCHQNAVWLEYLLPNFSSLSIEEIVQSVLESQRDKIFRLEEIVQEAVSEDLDPSDLRLACVRFRPIVFEGVRIQRWFRKNINGREFFSYSLAALD